MCDGGVPSLLDDLLTGLVLLLVIFPLEPVGDGLEILLDFLQLLLGQLDGRPRAPRELHQPIHVLSQQLTALQNCFLNKSQRIKFSSFIFFFK